MRTKILKFLFRDFGVSFVVFPPIGGGGGGGGYEDIRYRLYMILVMFMDRIDERPGRYPEGVGMRIFIQICVDKFAICFRAHCKYWCAVCCVCQLSHGIV
jgi:hypothetical protein